MENKSSSPGAFAFKYGLILGAVLIFYSVFLHAMDMTTNKLLGYLVYLIILGYTCWVIKLFRDTRNGGYLRFGEGFKVGFVCGLTGVVLSAVFSFFLFKYIDPSILDKMMAMGEEEMASKGYSAAEIEQSLPMMKWMMNPTVLLIFGIFGAAFWGAIGGIIGAAIFQKKQDAFSEAMKETME